MQIVAFCIAPAVTHNVDILPNEQLSGPKVVVLAYDGLCTFEFGIASEIFGLPRPEMGSHWFRYGVAGVDDGMMRAAGGIRVISDGGLDLVDGADVVVVPGWRGVDEEVPARITQKLVAAWSRGASLVSICSGVFVLAATGLLNGRRATTHWRYQEALQSRFPLIDVSKSAIYTDDNRLLTSAGSAAGIDVCLHVVRQQFGLRAANSVAQRLVVPAHREGSQAQLLARPVAPEHERGRISALLDQLRSNLDTDLSVLVMAETTNMSERTFRRRFESATGLPPLRWLLKERLSRARELLASTDMSIDEIASSVGLGGAANLRHHFRQQYGFSPRDFRLASRVSPVAA